MRRIFHLLNLFVVAGCLPLSAQLTFSLPSTNATCGEVIQIPITVTDFDSLTTVQLTVNWNTEFLAYQNSTQVSTNDANTVINTDVVAGGILSFNWQSGVGESLADGDTLIVIDLLTISSNLTTTNIQFSLLETTVTSVSGTVIPFLNNGVITLQGNDAPPFVSSCPDTVVQYTDATSCIVVGEWEEPQFQSCDGTPLAITTSQTLGTSFDIGTRTITYTATDEAGRSGSCSFVHIVRDTIAPVISNCPDNFEVNFSTENGCDLSVDWAAPAFLERCSSTETMVSSNFNPGDNFPVGTTVVEYMATDAMGNTSNCSFEVVVTGSAPITFERQPENVTISAAQGLCGANYDWDGPPVAVSGCTPVNIVSNIQPGDFFPVGTTVVEYVATDQVGQRAVWAFSVTVIDDQPIIARCPTDITIDANGRVQTDDLNFIQSVSTDNCGNYDLIINDIEVIDNCSAIINRTLTSGDISDFSTGTTILDYSISNDSGESTSCSFQITIQEAPAIAITRSQEMACVDTDFQLMAIADEAGFYDTWRWSGPNDFTSFDQNPFIPLTKESEGVYEVTASSTTGSCTATASTEIEVFGLPGTPSIESDRLIICEGESFTLSTVGTTGATYEWQGPDNFMSNDLTVQFDQATPAQTGAYSLIRTFEGCTSAPADVRVIVLSDLALEDDVISTFINNEVDFEVLANDSFEIDAGFTITTFPEPASGTLINNGDGTFNYLPNDDFVGKDQVMYEICYDACPDFCASGLITIDIAITDELCTYPTFLSPNGDADNETLLFPCNDLISGNAGSGLTVFNQYGAIVYQASPYNNDWQGTYNNEPLPDGTYYYIYKASADDPNPIKNCLTIFR